MDAVRALRERCTLPVPDALRQQVRPDRAAALVKDSLYVGIGFAVLGFQRAQVLRRELERSLSGNSR